MNNTRRKTRELNKLSAYLDNALSPMQSRKLEARLAADPALQEKLEHLRKTKMVLSRLTRHKAPRNFTLVPDMLPERKPRNQPLQTTLRLASALAAILLVVLFGIDFILGEIRQPLMLEAEAPLMEAARVPEEESPEPLIQWGPPGGEASGMGGDTAIMEEPMLEMEPLPEDEQAPEIQEQEADEPPASKGGDLILGINTDRSGEVIDRSQPTTVQPEPERLPWPEILQWVQIALAAIAVGGGLALLILHLRKQA
jgi:hypothetical protein